MIPKFNGDGTQNIVGLLPLPFELDIIFSHISSIVIPLAYIISALTNKRMKKLILGINMFSLLTSFANINCFKSGFISKYN